MRYDSSSSRIEMYVSSTRSFSAGAGVGTLHGLWSTDNLMTTSDKRLKRQIRPLREALQEAQLAAAPTTPGPATLAAEEVEDPEQWVLSRLRPVSYRMRDEAV